MTDTTLAEIANVVGGYAFKSVDLGSSGYPVVKIAEISPPRIRIESCDRISTEKVKGLDRFELRDGDILMAMTGATTGKTGRLRTTERIYLNQRVAKLSAKKGPEFDDYVWAVVSQPGFDRLVLANAHGSAQPNVSADGIGRIRIPLLPAGDQLHIGQLVRAIDDKIEQNRRTTQALEQLARAIFRAWFVDFEPVKVKVAGATSFPSMPQRVFDALPARFVDSAIGPVPEGWEVKAIGDLASIKGGKQLARERFSDEGTVPVFGGAGVMGHTTDHNSVGYVISVGRVGAYCGQFFSYRGKAWINNNASLIVPRRNIPGEWLFLALGFLNMEIIKKGAAQPFVSNSDIAKMENVWPGNSSITSFMEIAAPLLHSAEATDSESHKLTEMRDYLLPRLLSGTVRVEAGHG